MTDLISRLRATEPRKTYMTTSRTSPPMEGEYQALINPDGPEAADLIERIFLEDTPTLAARLISELDTDESESPVDYRPGDYKPRVEVAKYVIGKMRGEAK